MTPRISLPEVVGKGYGEFWRSTQRYQVVKGSRGSKKSTTAAMKMIWSIMRQPLSNGLVVRRYYSSLKDSCFAQLIWATNRLGVAHLWRYTRSPLQMWYIPTGQTILFRGMDDPQSVTSITVQHGYLNLVWLEESFQITDEEGFNKLDMSIRGDMPGGYHKQIIMTFNPWNEHHWLKRRFFDTPDPDVLAMTTDYRCNEWLGKDDRALFEKMRVRWPRRYQVEGLGDWGVSEGLIYTDWESRHVDRDYLLHSLYNGEPRVRALYGMDFGFAQDPTAAVEVLADTKNDILYVSDEIYEHGLTNEAIARAIRDHGWASRRITADSAEPRTIDELYRLGIERIVGAAKGPDSIRAGIQRLQDYHMVIDPRCVNVIRELSNYQWKTDRYDGHLMPRPLENGFDHAMDAMRYATESLTGPTFSFSEERRSNGGFEFV
jgi:phage terminase large subunit